MSPRIAPILVPALTAVAIAIAGCAGAAVGPTGPVASPPVSPAPVTTPEPTAVATSALATATVRPDTGDVAADQSGPQLSVEPVNAQAIRVTLVDPEAKAWRLVVDGTGDHSGDRWVLQVETGDIGPVITTSETVPGVQGQPVEQPDLESGIGRGQICSTILPVCLRAVTVRLPDEGNGTLVAELVRTDAALPLRVAGSTASWPTDPFVLGPWTMTEAFPWES